MVVGLGRLLIFQAKSRQFYQENIYILWHKLPIFSNPIYFISIFFYKKNIIDIYHSSAR